MTTFVIEIHVNGTYATVTPDPNMPFMLADEIKRIVEEYYQEEL